MSASISSRSFSLARRTTLGVLHIDIPRHDGQQRRRVPAERLRRSWRNIFAGLGRRGGTSVARHPFCPGFSNHCFPNALASRWAACSRSALNGRSSADAGRGQSAFTQTPVYNIRRAASTARLCSQQVSRVYGQYASLWIRNASRVSNDLGLPDRLARQAVSVGLSAYLPVYNKMRQDVIPGKTYTLDDCVGRFAWRRKWLIVLPAC